MTRFHHVKGDTNPADILSKHWDYTSVWPVLKPVLFWKGDTGVLDEEEDKEHKEDKPTDLSMVEGPDCAMVPVEGRDKVASDTKHDCVKIIQYACLDYKNYLS